MVDENAFRQSFSERLARELQENPRVDNEGKTGGYFSAYVDAPQDHGVAKIRIWLSSFGRGKVGGSHVTNFAITSQTKDVEQAKLLLPIADGILRQHGFYNTNQAHTFESALRELGVEITTFLEENRVTYPQTEGQPTAIFSASTPPPTSSRKKSFEMNIILRPTSHLELSKTGYVPSPDLIKFSLNTDDKEVAKDILAASIQFLEKIGLKDYLLKTKRDTSRIIPPEWIDLEKIGTLNRSRDKYIPIAISQGSRTQHIPHMSISSGTTEEKIAQEMAYLLKEEYLPNAIASSEPISLDSIKDFLEQRGYNLAPQTARRPSLPSDLREIWAGDKLYATLYSPRILLEGDSNYSLAIQIAPPHTRHSEVIGTSALSHTMPINTSDFEQAKRMRRNIQDLAEAILTSHFQQNPDQQLLTEPRQVYRKGDRIISAIKIQHDLDATDEFKSRFLDGRALHELLQRPIDYARSLSWQISIGEERDGKTPIAIQAVRNFGEPLSADLFPWNGNYTVFAHSPEAATYFRKIVQTSLLNEQSLIATQQPEFSKDRSVTYFGDPSTKLILQKSLMQGLVSKDIEVESQALQILQQKARKEIIY